MASSSIGSCPTSSPRPAILLVRAQAVSSQSSLTDHAARRDSILTSRADLQATAFTTRDLSKTNSALG